ncbi:DNA starvation/stationary phase protection protein [Simiduia curdlanivorans]|uniref:Dps family protein n=1 Tax=Simiduia curdlanivorans TaxID=1492769 RepID=A0ABV8V8W6_9GAMM|nr:DNA starvation/stationary phase protection protein [Simiduia curdlanivorans]MDN3638564.1 DNA starvation/stationary phase protection protein [Simiduia curdlanivorans]
MNTATVLSSKPKEQLTENGINRADRSELATFLSKALADTFLLNVKTLNFHWNVMGPLFYSLHKLTEEQYRDLTDAIDVIAERIRALGFVAPGSLTKFAELTDIIEESGTPSAENMINQLADDNERCARSLRVAVAAAEEIEDVKTADLLTDRIGQHEENAWMLRAIVSS